jgi:multidrug efflux system membrane fusion protein
MTPPNTARRYRLILLVFALLVVAAAAWFYRDHFSSAPADSPAAADKKGGDKGKNSDKGKDKPIAVSVETVTQGDFSVYLNGLGTVVAQRLVTVRPRVDGELQQVLFREGQQVKAGELLAVIDPRPFQIQLQQAEGQLLRDQALLKNAEIDLNRYQTLLEQDSIAAQQTETQAAQVMQLRGTVEMNKAQVNNAKLQLSYSQVTAPISGRIGLRLVDQGNIVHANDANGLVVITQQQPITVVFSLPEDKVPALIKRWQSNPQINVTAYDRSGKTPLASGRLLAFDNQIDPSTGTLKLKAQFDNTDNALFVNQFVNIKLHIDTLLNVAQVSTAAVQTDPRGAFVFKLSADNTVQQQRLTLGPVEGTTVTVLEGLAGGDTVVVDGLDKLRDGKVVDVAIKDRQAQEASPKQASNPAGKGKKGGEHGKHKNQDKPQS